MQGRGDRRDHVEAQHDGQGQDDEVAAHSQRAHQDDCSAQQDGDGQTDFGEVAAHEGLLLRLLGVLRVLRGLLLRGDGDTHRWWRPEDGGLLAVVEGDGDGADDLVIQVQHALAVLLRGDQLEQVDDVLAEQLGGLARQAARQVGVADDGHAVVGDEDLARLRQRTVTAVGCRQVDDDAARTHVGDIFFGEQHRGGAAWNVCGGDDDVGLGGLLGVDLRSEFRLVLGHLLGVAVLGLLSLLLDGDEFRTHGFDLLASLDAQVGGLDDRAHGVGGTDRGQAGDTSADDVDLCRRHLTCRGDLAGEQSTEGVGGLDDCAVAGDVRHGGQHVHGLCAGNARHSVHREPSDATVGELVDELLVAAWGHAADQGGSGAHEVTLFLGRGVECRDDVRFPDLLAYDARAGLAVEGVRVGGVFAGTCLYFNVIAELDELADRVWCGCHQRLVLTRLNRNTDTHFVSCAVFWGMKIPGTDRNVEVAS